MSNNAKKQNPKAPAQQKPKAPALPGATRPVGIAKKQFSRMTDELPAESLYPPLDVPKGMANALSATPYRAVPQATRSSDPTAMRMPGPPKSTHFSDVELKGAFQTFDLGSENKIGVEELRHLFCTMGDEFEQEELEMMVKLLDVNNIGGVAYAEFFSLFRTPEQLFRSRYVSDFLKNRNEEKRLAELLKGADMLIGDDLPAYVVDLGPGTCTDSKILAKCKEKGLTPMCDHTSYARGGRCYSDCDPHMVSPASALPKHVIMPCS